MPGPKETAYDNEITQLVAQIEKLCEIHKIPFVASFGLDGDLCCSCGCASPDRNPNIQLDAVFRFMMSVIKNGVPTSPTMMINVRDADGNITSSTAVIG